eukprot:GHVP01021570.1.p1 GENE.GHVP01021570.1~~GHVP01021570.1.p1  ORF type:complete len:105 (+),score=0.81 GHVP01021570.1:881-1195(+)
MTLPLHIHTYLGVEIRKCPYFIESSHVQFKSPLPTAATPIPVRCHTEVSSTGLFMTSQSKLSNAWRSSVRSSMLLRFRAMKYHTNTQNVDLYTALSLEPNTAPS